MMLLYTILIFLFICTHNHGHQKWIELFEKFDPEGAGRISTEDFLLALDSDQWPRSDPQCTAARASLKCKVLEYGTSFITTEEFCKVVS